MQWCIYAVRYNVHLMLHYIGSSNHTAIPIYLRPSSSITKMCPNLLKCNSAFKQKRRRSVSYAIKLSGVLVSMCERACTSLCPSLTRLCPLSQWTTQTFSSWTKMMMTTQTQSCTSLSPSPAAPPSLSAYSTPWWVRWVPKQTENPLCLF